MFDRRNAYRHLLAVPKSEILATLQGMLDNEQLLDLFQNVRAHPVSADDLRRATHEELIRIAEAVDNFTEEDALHLNEEFRYRGTKTLYIFSYSIESQDSIDQMLQSDDWLRLNEAVGRAYDEFDQRLVTLKYSDLSLKETDRFSVGNESVWEIVYSYIAQVRATDPETEEVAFYPDLRYGFIWVSRTTPWIAISAKDEGIADMFAEALAQFLGAAIARLPVPKEAEIAIESYDNVRRVTHVDGRGVRKRIIHQNLHTFPEEVSEVQLRDREQMRTSSGYNAEVDGIHFVISYSREKGAISFSKLLPTSLLRQFGVEKIVSVYNAVQDLVSQSPEEFVPLVVNRVLIGSREKTKGSIQEILSKLATARKAHLDEVQIDVSPYELARLGKYFTLKTEVQCIDCGDLQYIQCIHCGAEDFHSEKDQLVCTQCNASVEPSGVRCASGHEINLTSAHEVITLYPTQSLLSVTERTLAQASEIKFNRHEEGFFVRGTTLHTFGTHGEKTIYLLGDILEFREPASLSLSEQQRRILSVVLRQYREKCRRMALGSCAACVQSRVDQYCFLRLFGLYDRRYTPRPHHGGEFGDVSLDVTIDGRQDQTLVILLKRGNPNGRPITMRHSIGRDLYTQMDAFWTDPRTAVIGVAVPQRLEDGFAARIHRQAYKHGKRLVIFGVEELSKIVQFVADRDGLSSDDL